MDKEDINQFSLSSFSLSGNYTANILQIVFVLQIQLLDMYTEMYVDLSLLDHIEEELFNIPLSNILIWRSLNAKYFIFFATYSFVPFYLFLHFKLTAFSKRSWNSKPVNL